MKNWKIGILGAVLVLFCGCATVDGANYATNISGNQSAENGDDTQKNIPVTKTGLVISGEEAANISTDYFGVLKFTFRNTTDEWVRIKRVKIYFDNEEIDKNVYIPVGEELFVWQDAVSKKIAIDNRNSGNFWAAVGIISGITAIASDDEATSNVAGAAFGSSIIGATVSDYKTAKKYENMAATIYPKEHLLSGKILVPPGLFVNRFIVLNSKNNSKIGYLSSINIEYETDKGVVDKVKLQFRKSPYERVKGYTNSKWQKQVFDEIEKKESSEQNTNEVKSGPYN